MSENWDVAFDVPILTPDGQVLRTLHDARLHLLKLSPTVAQQPLWQTAVELVLLVGKEGGPTDFARIGMMQALYPGRMRTETTGLRYRSK
jgi:hypothetical protein